MEPRAFDTRHNKGESSEKGTWNSQAEGLARCSHGRDSTDPDGKKK